MSEAGISDEAVKAKTGKGREEWFTILDKAGAKDMEHKAIALYLYEKHKVPGWWCQMVTVEYEKARGKRVLGQTVDVGFQIGVSKTVGESRAALWDLLMSPDGLKTWLGIADVSLEQGSEYKTADGTSGEIRVVKQPMRLRLTWQPKDWQKPSTIQIWLEEKDSQKTIVTFHHEKLADAAAREKMKKHWQKILKELFT